jgi:hypothetical protein
LKSFKNYYHLSLQEAQFLEQGEFLLPSIILEMSYNLTVVVLNRYVRSIESRNEIFSSQLSLMSYMTSSISLFDFLLNIPQIEGYDVDVCL